MKDVVTVKEFQPIQPARKLERSDITDLKDWSSGVFTNKNGQLYATNYVGIITTRSGAVIEILPKFDLVTEPDNQNRKTREMFLSMLRHWRGKGFKRLTDSQIRSLRNFPMLEVFVYLFLANVHEIVRRGLARQYVQFEENLTYLRGRLLFSEHLRENMIDKSRFFVSHDEFSENRPANRLIRKVLELLAPQITNSTNYQSLQQLKNAFYDIPPSKNIYADWQNHYVDRNMQSYESVMRWVRLFLFNEGLVTYAGKHENVSLLFPMEEVFEDFVTHSFRRYQSEYRVRAQRPMKHLATEGQKKAFYMKPDISLMSGSTVHFILDAKWKRVDTRIDDKKHNIVQQDMYQMYAYGKNYKCKTVALVFPKNENFIDPLEYKFTDRDLTLICLPLDVEDPSFSVRKSMEALERKLE